MHRGLRYRIIFALGLTGSVLFGLPRESAAKFALMPYFEASGGLSLMLNAQNIITGGTPGMSGLAPGMGLGFLTGLTDGGNFIDGQIGIVGRFNYGSSGALSMATLVPYLMGRIQMKMFYAGYGISFIGWTRNLGYFGFDGLTPGPTGWIPMIAEFGLIYGATPSFSVGISATAQLPVAPNVGLVLGPALDGQIFARMYFGSLSFGAEKEEKKPRPSVEYQGWRYPYGTMK